jgi:hypothetical protein
VDAFFAWQSEEDARILLHDAGMSTIKVKRGGIVVSQKSSSSDDLDKDYNKVCEGVQHGTSIPALWDARKSYKSSLRVERTFPVFTYFTTTKEHFF